MAYIFQLHSTQFSSFLSSNANKILGLKRHDSTVLKLICSANLRVLNTRDYFVTKIMKQMQDIGLTINPYTVHMHT